MPLYDFECPSCGHAFEELVAAGESPPCPSCGADGAQRRFSPFAPLARLGKRTRSEREADKRRRDKG